MNSKTVVKSAFKKTASGRLLMCSYNKNGILFPCIVKFHNN